MPRSGWARSMPGCATIVAIAEPCYTITNMYATDKHRIALLVVHEGGLSRLLCSPDLVEAVGAGVELRLLEYLATQPLVADGWVDVDGRSLAPQLRSSYGNIRRALIRLRELGLVQQRRPRSSLWRVTPGLTRHVHLDEKGGSDSGV